MRWTDAPGAGSESRRPSSSWGSPTSAVNPDGANSSLNGEPDVISVGRSFTEIEEELRRRMHQPIPEQGRWPGGWRGFFRYAPCRPTSRHCAPSITTSRSHGCARYSAAARRIARRGGGSRRSHPTISRSQQPFIRGRRCALPSHTQGGSRMREFRSRGSVRGAVGNDRPYRERMRSTCFSGVCPVLPESDS